MTDRELLPCPFCGAGKTEVREDRPWLGTKWGEPVSVSVRHWCDHVDGQPSRMIERVGRDRAAAVAAWNMRTTGREGEGRRAMIQLKLKRLHPDAIIPRYATAGAACFDLHSISADTLEPGMACEFRTGLAVELPANHVMLVYSRSGHGFRYGVRLANAVGVIDSDYRGEIIVKLRNDGAVPLTVNRGDRIAQAMVLPVPSVELIEVDELSTTERGAGGFGSTGDGG